MMSARVANARRGYSLTVVLLFLVLLLSLWAAVYRTTSSYLRVETARVKRDDLDTGLMNALGQALMYLEKNPSLARTSVTTYGIKTPPTPLDPQGQDFTATFTPGSSSKDWTVKVTPGPWPVPLPSF